ncbi:MAG: GTP cyclohydrolase I FolE [Puniceicoccales bacterium]|jgi:GTP cyclohydrolase I|nr:GTP cyclohydrolase I FolE [Puniceicoccales bacterium]
MSLQIPNGGIIFRAVMDVDMVAAGVEMILRGIGEDVSRRDLVHTPKRVAKIWETFFAAQEVSDEELLNRAFVAEEYDDFVVVKNIQFSSFCEHHLLPFFGKISVAYIPKDGVVVGISKLVRVVDKYSKRLQLQERLTKQILDAIAKNISNDGILVIASAQHMCMAMRGVMQPGSETVTRAMSGKFLSDGNIVLGAQQLIFGSNGKKFQ